ncbi:MAG TPA: hypothetical protein VMZ53_03540 [Kofleriaceae bacterium]|nr:hypothetical protein [Kofleriaceae bacterium]
MLVVMSYDCVLFAVVWTLACEMIALPLVVDPILLVCAVDHEPLVESLSPVSVIVVPAST